MAVEAIDINDLTESTLKQYGPARFEIISTTLQQHWVMNLMLRQDRVEFQGGQQLERKVHIDAGTATGHVLLYQETNVGVSDHLKAVTVPWRHAREGWVWEDRELLINRGNRKIVDMNQARRVAAIIRMAETLETAAWTSPSSSSDETEPYGFPYWIVENATTGFTGTVPSGHTTVGGLNPTTYSNWRNYSVTYTTIDKIDAIPKWRTLNRAIHWMPPTMIAEQNLSNSNMALRLYTNESVTSNLETVGEQQNENLGRDLAPFFKDFKFSSTGTIVWRGYPIIPVPQLDSDATNPVYFVDHNTFVFGVLQGDYLKETTASGGIKQPRVNAVFLDLTWNLLCWNRRRNAVSYYTA